MEISNTKDGEVRMHPLRLVLVAAVTVTTLLMCGVPPVPAGAEESARVSTDPTGAQVELRQRQTWFETRHAVGAPPGECLRRWILSPGAFALRPTPNGDFREVPLAAAPGPEYQPYHVWCGTRYLDTVWIRPQQFGVDPLDLAQRLVRDLPYPAASVGTNPRTRGLTGLETWFWVDGYTGAPISDVVTAFGMRVEVDATPSSVSWDFGDGTTAKGLGLGSGPPSRSNVVHSFETRARPTFPVRALIMLSVRWRLNAGPWQDLDPVVRTAVRAYPVVESRAALVSDP